MSPKFRYLNPYFTLLLDYSLLDIKFAVMSIHDLAVIVHAWEISSACVCKCSAGLVLRVILAERLVKCARHHYQLEIVQTVEGWDCLTAVWCGAMYEFVFTAEVIMIKCVWSIGTVQDSGSLDCEFQPNLFVSLGKILSLNCFIDLSDIVGSC